MLMYLYALCYNQHVTILFGSIYVGALNLPGTSAIGSFMSNFGGSANSPATTYKVTMENDQLFLDL